MERCRVPAVCGGGDAVLPHVRPTMVLVSAHMSWEKT